MITQVREERVKQVRPPSEFLMRLGLFITRVLPPRLGYALAEWAARTYGRFAHETRMILESNLEPVLETSDPHRLRAVALEVFRHFARAYYDLFYLPSLPPEKIAKMVVFEEPGWTQVQEISQQGTGVVLAGIHMSSFDLCGQAVVARGFPMLVLALPEEGFALMNKMRAFQEGGSVMLVGPAAIRQALRVLRRGGMVATGADRPIKDQGTIVEFFGRPTLLPDGPVRLAMHVRAGLFGSFCFREEGQYFLRFQPVDLVQTGNTEKDVRENLQRLARTIEPVIRAHPEQWHLFQRLWD